VPEDPFVSTIDAMEAGSLCRRLQPEKYSWSYLFCVHPSVSPLLGGRVSGNRRFSVQFASASGENPCPARKEPGDLGFGPGGTPSRALPKCRPAVHLVTNTSRYGGESVGQSTRKEKWVGSWVVASKSGSRISRADKCGRKESSVDLLVDTQAGPVDPDTDSNHELDRILKSRNLLILQSR
jgi:hypothetical protein